MALCSSCCRALLTSSKHVFSCTRCWSLIIISIMLFYMNSQLLYEADTVRPLNTRKILIDSLPKRKRGIIIEYRDIEVPVDTNNCSQYISKALQRSRRGLHSVSSQELTSEIDVGILANCSNPHFSAADINDQSKRISAVVNDQLVKDNTAENILINYLVPSIQKDGLNVDCPALLRGDEDEMVRVEDIMRKQMRPKVPIYEETYLKWTENCTAFRRMRGYVETPLSTEEEEFPLAFSISMYRDVEQVERLLRAIYQPQNIYCVHIDTKSSLLIHRTMRAIFSCFDNVFIPSVLNKVKWGDASVLYPDLACMRDLVRAPQKAWRYLINLTGQEFPLRTNLELVRIAKIFNGSNDISGSSQRIDRARIEHKWAHRWSKTYQQTIFYDTLIPREPPPYNLTFFKGEVHALFSPGFVKFVVKKDVARSFLAWCESSGHASEHYWNTLNYNLHLHAPGGYDGPPELAHAYSYTPVVRAKHWVGANYGVRPCGGYALRGICVYGVRDLHWLHTRPEMFANKFNLTYDYPAYDCLEERHRNRTRLGALYGTEVVYHRKDGASRIHEASRTTRIGGRDGFNFENIFYAELPTVKYGRKDSARSG